MANPFFSFKEFTVYHDKCAMKVGTDGVLLGAWVDIEGAQTILDVGCGSGLISLMLAQRTGEMSEILAVDIDEGAVEQTKVNITESRFANIRCELQSFLDMENQPKFDLIVSNPPFFKKSLCSPDPQRSLARHSNSLEIADIFEKADKLLSDNGKLSLIYPFEFKDDLLYMAKRYSLKMFRMTNVRSTSTGNYKRILFECIKSDNEILLQEDELTIETSRHVYSPEFINLMKSFYLKL